MSTEEKRVCLLLKAIIFHYHGFDDIENLHLEDSAKSLDATEELKWVMEFIQTDHITAFERARGYLNDIVGDYPREKRVELIKMVWESNKLKGFVTELEMTAILKLATDWGVESEMKPLVFEQ